MLSFSSYSCCLLFITREGIGKIGFVDASSLIRFIIHIKYQTSAFQQVEVIEVILCIILTVITHRTDVTIGVAVFRSGDFQLLAVLQGDCRFLK